jgi:hypothetical protein
MEDKLNSHTKVWDFLVLALWTLVISIGCGRPQMTWQTTSSLTVEQIHQSYPTQVNVFFGPSNHPSMINASLQIYKTFFMLCSSAALLILNNMLEEAEKPFALKS